jgi:hypothetical protein
MARLTDELERRRLDRLVEQLTQQLRVHRSLNLDTGVSRDGTSVWASEGP